MSRSPSPAGKAVIEEEEEEMHEEEEKETPVDEEEKNGVKFIRNRFKYQDKKFEHNYVDKLPVNRSQFGHKKYSIYTDGLKKLPTVRDQVRGSQRWHKNLNESREENGPAQGKKGRSGWLSRIWTFVSIISIIGTIIQKMHKPTADPNMMKLGASQKIVQNRIVELGQYLNKAEFAPSLVFKAYQEVGEILNESSLAEIALQEIKANKITQKIWRLIDDASSKCVAPDKHYLLMVSINFLYHLMAAGGESYVNKNSAGHFIQHCHDIKDLNTAIFVLLMTATEHNDGLASLNGIGKTITNSFIREEFGPWDFPPMKFFGLWSQRANKLLPDDESAVCKFADFAVKHRDSWSRDFNSMVCLLSQNVKCPAFETFDMETLYIRDECREIFMQFPKREKREEL